jgi:hydrogenase nickel incorporation protein HypB
LPYVDFDIDYLRRGIKALNPSVVFFTLSCKTGEGIADWIAWLQEQLMRVAQTVPAG